MDKLISKNRRSRFEICLEIIELCQTPGIPVTPLGLASRCTYATLKEILSSLLTGELLKIETRPISYSGGKRKTNYYVRTVEGDKVLTKFNEIEKRISMSGSPS